MKKQHTVRPFVAGVLVTLFLVAMIPSAAALTGQSATIFPGVSIYIDDQKLNPTDANGNPVEAFIYNGTTYLPVRAVSEALGRPVQWDGATSSVYVGKHSGDKPAAWLSQLDYFSGTASNGFYTSASENDNLGNTHYHCVTRSFDRTYKLNGQYSRMTGVMYQTYEGRSRNIYKGCGITIYGDGEILYTNTASQQMTGLEPTPFDIDLTGVLELRIMFNSASSNFKYHLSLGDVGLWT